MGRLSFAFTTPAICLVALASLTACTGPAQISATQTSALPIPALPGNLIGSTPNVLAAEFGQPTLLRIDGTAQVWLYHSTSCGLNLILYPDAAGVPRVAMATAADGSPATGDCSASLQQSHIDAVSTLPSSAALRGPATAAALEPPSSS